MMDHHFQRPCATSKGQEAFGVERSVDLCFVKEAQVNGMENTGLSTSGGKVNIGKDSKKLERKYCRHWSRQATLSTQGFDEIAAINHIKDWLQSDSRLHNDWASEEAATSTNGSISSCAECRRQVHQADRLLKSSWKAQHLFSELTAFLKVEFAVHFEEINPNLLTFHAIVFNDFQPIDIVVNVSDEYEGAVASFCHPSKNDIVGFSRVYNLAVSLCQDSSELASVAELLEFEFDDFEMESLQEELESVKDDVVIDCSIFEDVFSSSAKRQSCTEAVTALACLVSRTNCTQTLVQLTGWLLEHQTQLHHLFESQLTPLSVQYPMAATIKMLSACTCVHSQETLQVVKVIDAALSQTSLPELVAQELVIGSKLWHKRCR